MRWGRSRDTRRAVQKLASDLPPDLAPLALLAYNYWWSWQLGGPDLFREIDPHRWSLCQHNPIRQLRESANGGLERKAGDRRFVNRAEALAESMVEALERPSDPGPWGEHRPTVFLCSEYAIHASLPIYAGGLGVLAGDLLKEASDRRFPMMGIGLLYRKGYFHQRIDGSGWQHEYWIDIDPERLPMVRMTDGDERPLTLQVPIFDRLVHAHVWRVNIGRVPLYLLDTELLENRPLDRWIGARLYDGNPNIRLAQYALLGIGAMRLLEALGIEPGVVHLNEGHGALAILEYCAMNGPGDLSAALAAVRERFVFTTHTPVAAGNETYEVDTFLDVFQQMPERLGIDTAAFQRLFRVRPDEPERRIGLTPLAIRSSRSVNGVSRRHGAVARQMWQPLFPSRAVDGVPITHVTNGVHLPTWMGPAFQTLLDRYLAEGWRIRASDATIWEDVDRIPDQAVWEARNTARRELIELVRRQSVTDRLMRGDPLGYVEAAARAFDDGVLTMGFARRLASYKRLHLIASDPARAVALLNREHGLQFLFGGKAHPTDDDAKRIVQNMFLLKYESKVGARVAFLEDHDLGIARVLVAGCDFWVNLPRPPLEASGTSGMKAVLNGNLNLSVLDGWWAEAFDGTNGWAIAGEQEHDAASQDARHAALFYERIENEILPMFYRRDEDGLPREWIARVKAGLKTLAPRFNATRMLNEYIRKVYRPEGNGTAPDSG
jgi:starch phosphorylase